MYVVFEDGSRQYRVSEGDRVTIDYRDIEIGATLELTKVLLLANGTDLQIGRPLLEGARVVGEVISTPSIKTMTQKFRRRKASKRLKGHRQHYVEIRVKHILAAGQTAPESKKPAETPAPESAPAN